MADAVGQDDFTGRAIENDLIVSQDLHTKNTLASPWNAWVSDPKHIGPKLAECLKNDLGMAATANNNNRRIAVDGAWFRRLFQGSISSPVL